MSRSRIASILCLIAIVASSCGSNGSSGAGATNGSATGASGSPSGVSATASATGSAPVAGESASSVPSPTRPAADWPVYHRDAARTGVSADFPAATGSLAVAWTAKLDGAVYGQPLGVGGRVIAATENDTVYALDPASGDVAWQRHLGTPVALRTLPCGNIDPLGITSTAAYDATTGTLFVVAELQGPKHELFALDPETGQVRWSRGLDLPGDDPHNYQQRAALALGNGYVYAGFGGLAGDCGQYRGVVVGVRTDGSGSTISYRVPVTREGAVWSTGGPVVDSNGDVYISVGNGESTTTYDGSDSVVQLSPDLQMKSRFAPASWAHDNAGDADLGSLSPVLVGDRWVFIAGKAAVGYVLRRGALGGIGGQVSSRPVCAAYGAAAVSGSTVFVPCEDGIARVEIGSTGAISIAWQTKSGAGGPPVVGGGAVWSVDIGGGYLFELSPETGAAIAHVAVGEVPHFASPTLSGGLVLVGTMSGVTAVRP